MKAGNIVFLTERKKKPYYRILISKGIALFTKYPNQKLEDVKVHAAIIYNYKGIFYVRDMDKDGDDHYTIDKYFEKYKGRIEIKINPFLTTTAILNKFNNSCRNTKVKYDFWNTFFFQIIKTITGKFIGKKTSLHRMCAEDARTQFNILKNIFSDLEGVNPNAFHNEIMDWEIWKK